MITYLLIFNDSNFTRNIASTSMPTWASVTATARRVVPAGTSATTTRVVKTLKRTTNASATKDTLATGCRAQVTIQ